MKQWMQFTAVAMCCVMLYGCPYESHVPIDAPKIPVEENLLGKWKTDAESYSTYYITKANSLQYKVQQKTSVGNTMHYIAHLSEVRGATFLNLYSDSTKTYYLYRIRLDADGSKLTLMPFAEKLDEKFVNSTELRNYVEKNMNLQSLYDNDDKEDFEKVSN